MKKTALTLALFLLASFALCGPCLAEAAEEEFSKMDADQDGKVSKGEFVRWYPVQAWGSADADGDGQVVATEWIPVRESLSKYRREQSRDSQVKK